MRPAPRTLFAFYRERAAAREPLVLATVVGTEGSTYRKPGAQMLLAGDGSSVGLLSGGCLETDLAERAQRVLATSKAEVALYDARSSDDPIWGLGLGCEGAMRILLSRLDPSNDYQPLAFAAEQTAKRQAGATALVIESSVADYPPGHAWHSASADTDERVAGILDLCRSRAADGGFGTHFLSRNDLTLTVFIAALDRPARLLILGTGPDATPVVDIAMLLGWQITIADHRPAYLERSRFPEDVEVIELEPRQPLPELEFSDFDAAVVMSHNLEADARYLRALARSSLPYVGLLGPAARRRRLLADLGPLAQELGDRLYGPVGLDIGARTPEAIAVAIVAEIQAFLSGRRGEPFRDGVRILAPLSSQESD